MTKDKDFKNLVRARMAETRENFTTARAMLLKERPPEPAGTTQRGPSNDDDGTGQPASSQDDLATLVAHQIDTAVSARDLKRRRVEADHSKQRQFVEHFAAGASDALNIVAEALNRRAHALRFDSPVVVETEYSFESQHALSASIAVLMTKFREDRGTKGASASFDWKLYVSVPVGIETQDHEQSTQPAFTIVAHRDGWQDAWGCKIPTQECNPAGLSLASTGDDVARRFLAWFTRYVT